jgi:phage-related minor tail protein
LFTYFFTESKEKRERMWYDMQTEYESTLRELEYIAQQIQMLNIEYKEFLAEESDKKTFLKK